MKWLIKKRKNLQIFHNNDGIRLFELILYGTSIVSLPQYLSKKTNNVNLGQISNRLCEQKIRNNFYPGFSIRNKDLFHYSSNLKCREISNRSYF